MKLSSALLLLIPFLSIHSYGEFTTYQQFPTVGTLLIGQDGLTVSQTRGKLGATVSVDSVTEGKHYWETTANCGPDTWGFTIGALRADQIGVRMGASEYGYGIAGDGARKVNKNIPERFSDGFLPTVQGDVFMVALDMDEGEIFFGKNGIWLGNANPSTRTNPAYQGISGIMKAAVTVASRECDPNTLVTNFGQSEFNFEIPDGYFPGFCPLGECQDAAVREVEIVIQPHDQRCTKGKNRPVGIEVSIRGSEEIDVTTIDYSTISAGGLELDGEGLSDGACILEYVDDDEFVDATCRFRTGDIPMNFSGSTLDGDTLVGEGSVCLK